MSLRSSWTPRFLGLTAALLISTTPARAVILYGGTEGRVTTAPTGLLANSGWQFQGSWGAGVGTPIAPNHFITARHLGGGVGDVFRLGGNEYTVDAMFDAPENADLRIFRVAQTFDSYAQVYTGSNDVSGNPLAVVYGRGTARGADVIGPNGHQGYLWGGSDGLLSWGTNRITFSTTFPDGPGGEYLGLEFRPRGLQPGVPNPATFSAGDSGGGVFIQDTDGVWKLAGVNYAVDGDYSLEQGTGFFQAAMFDARDYYVGGPSSSFFVGHPSPDEEVWQSGYSARISSQLNFIMRVTGVPEPSAFLLTGLGLALAGAAARRRSRPAV
ncbi:MAG: PEP-CTERM sorting domain-containing protein [Isosphaeraceae bacterium]|nr:PEP-CTERM sorting domain-containing protein [Isosphaeraceae bacterium]